MTKQVCIHFIVSGLVQGVFFRDTTCQKAEELNLTGWIKNLADGRVEGMVCGEASQVAALCDWLWMGPPSANVIEVKKEEVEFKIYKNFQIIR